MTEFELNLYWAKLVKEFGKPTILKVSENNLFKNAENTCSRDAYGGSSWIDYWRSVTRNLATTLRCSSCDKEIVVGEPSCNQKLEWLLMGDTEDEHKAEGGHVWLTSPKGADWQGGRYITPLCPACNAKRGRHIILKKGSVLCKEVCANTDMNV